MGALGTVGRLLFAFLFLSRSDSELSKIMDVSM
jgi:hypothetical protein